VRAAGRPPAAPGGSPPCLAGVPDERVGEALVLLGRASALLGEAAQVAAATGDPDRMALLEDAAGRVRALREAFAG
jgi:hypothetical protein